MLLPCRYGDAGTATFTYTLNAETPEEMTYVGTKGSIHIASPAHCPVKMVIKTEGPNHARGDARIEEVCEFPLPVNKDGVNTLNFPGSEGFQYQALAVSECIKAGKRECPEYTHAETIHTMETMDEIRKQLGVR